MPKLMTFSTEKFLSPPEARGAPSPHKASPSPREELQALEQPALELLSGHLCTNQCWTGITLPWEQQEEEDKGFFIPRMVEHFFFPPGKGQQKKVFCPLKETGREEGTGFELQKKPAHYSKGGCKVQGHSVKEEKKNSFRAFTASIKAITLLHGTFTAPLQSRQQLFGGVGLKTSLLLWHQQTGLFFPHARTFPGP